MSGDRKEEIMPFELSSVSPRRAFWPLLCIGIILSAAIATICYFLPAYIGNLARPPFPSFIRSVIPYLGTASFAALLTGVPCWWLIIERPRRATILRGMIVGILGSSTAHPLMWTFLVLLSPILGGEWAESNLLEKAPLIILLSLMSLLYMGWITAAVGCLAGALLVRLRNALSAN